MSVRSVFNPRSNDNLAGGGLSRRQLSFTIL
jgi:hypothetical protein